MALLSVSSVAVRLAADNDGCIVGDGEKPGIPKTSKAVSSNLVSEARKKIYFHFSLVYTVLLIWWREFKVTA